MRSRNACLRGLCGGLHSQPRAQRGPWPVALSLMGKCLINKDQSCRPPTEVPSLPVTVATRGLYSPLPWAHVRPGTRLHVHEVDGGLPSYVLLIVD